MEEKKSSKPPTSTQFLNFEFIKTWDLISRQKWGINMNQPLKTECLIQSVGASIPTIPVISQDLRLIMRSFPAMSKTVKVVFWNLTASTL